MNGNMLQTRFRGVKGFHVGRLFLYQCMRPRLHHAVWIVHAVVVQMTTYPAPKKHRKAPPHPWEIEPVTRTIAREAPHMWPFAFGFLVTGYLFYKISSTVTTEDIERSTMSSPRH